MKSCFDHKNHLRFFLLVFVFIFSPVLQTASSQSSVQPTPTVGVNSISFDSTNKKYKFFLNNSEVYEYSIISDGSFRAVTAFDYNANMFMPSNGGIVATLGGLDNMSSLNGNVSYKLLSHQFLTFDTVLVSWAMIVNNDTCNYSYKFNITGRTMVIKVETDSARVNKASGIHLGWCESAIAPQTISIPYMPILSILFSNNNMFTSFFADWELTHASAIWPENYNVKNFPGAPDKKMYAQQLFYDKNNNNKRNRLQETLYLTTAQDMTDVLPNVLNPVSTYKDTSANQIVWDYRQPFARLIRRPWRHLDSLWDCGVRNIWLQVHDWQATHGTQHFNQDGSPNSSTSGYDDALPCVLPANPTNSRGNEYNGDAALDSVISIGRFKYGYRIGLHENYVDVYPNDTCGVYTNSRNIALNSLGQPELAWYNPLTHIQSYLLKPSVAAKIENSWSSQIQAKYNIDGCYLDVISGLIPNMRIDYDTSVVNAGMFRETLNNYRSLYSILRTNHHGPVQGEGGMHFLYQGYVDDVEARLTMTGPDSIIYGNGMNFPVLVDFDLLKLHSKTMVHGVGVYALFVPHSSQASRDTVLRYIATELAYGHGGYLPDVDATFDIGKHAQLEYKYVFSVQKDYADAMPKSIQYWDGNGNGPYTASTYIRMYPQHYADISYPTQFMGRVRVTYDNGVVVCVNRNPNTQSLWRVTVGSSGGWFNYHAVIGSNNDSLYTGICTTTTFTLPANNGWVVFDPYKTRLPNH